MPAFLLKDSFRMGIVSKSHSFELIIVLFDAAGIEILPIPVGMNPAVLVACVGISLDPLSVLVNPSTAVTVLGRFWCNHSKKGEFIVGFFDTVFHCFICLDGFPKGFSELLPALLGAKRCRSRRLWNSVHELSQ